MSDRFREFLKKIGSGTHTSKDLTREEAREALLLMLQGKATPAQIGAFFIAHRIKRPTVAELAGMFAAYEEMGPRLPALADGPVTVFGVPYDGRSRTAPATQLVALMLAAAGVPVLTHGGDRMPTKYGIPAIDIWRGLGIDWSRLDLDRAARGLARENLGFVYLPRHFPAAQALVPYREQIGKRPPLATLELIWLPQAGSVRAIAGYVHPPTEELFQAALADRPEIRLTTVKGLEGSCDLPRDRTAIVARPNDTHGYDRLLLSPQKYGFAGPNPPLVSEGQLLVELKAVLAGDPSPLTESVVWNGGFYLWHAGVTPSLETGFERARALLQDGKLARKRDRLEQFASNSVC